MGNIARVGECRVRVYILPASDTPINYYRQCYIDGCVRVGRVPTLPRVYISSAEVSNIKSHITQTS